ncbi:hypothetical protein PGTUg99_022002 [Puccinia graminis f. sp. tritici]|uniref:Uncharacterized protein n=1 Tax=Puccinia graminis f. sp. tritici TaxID=56615 RepID=A0A5B0M8V4_PUCGR|nr:hypothetical protein PGTUg99_022002 [Puccinia graminis f. sp. tritici]
MGKLVFPPIPSIRGYLNFRDSTFRMAEEADGDLMIRVSQKRKSSSKALVGVSMEVTGRGCYMLVLPDGIHLRRQAVSFADGIPQPTGEVRLHGGYARV